MVKDLLLQGSARAPQKYDLEVKLWCLDLSCTWQKLSQISPKSPLYIGGRGRRLALRAKPSRVRPATRRGGIQLQLGLEGGVLLFLPTSPFFLFGFYFLGTKAFLGYPTSPLRTCGATLGPWAHSRVGGHLPVNTRNPFVTPGTLPELPETFR